MTKNDNDIDTRLPATVQDNAGGPKPLDMDAVRRLGLALLTQKNEGTSFPRFVVREMRDGAYVHVIEFFTRDGAEKYIEDEGARHNDPHVWVGSGYANPEWRLVRALLLAHYGKDFATPENER